jgi:hypothetical protein
MTQNDLAFDRDLVDVGGRFMNGAEMAAAAEPLRIPGGGLYFRGRVGALGDVGPAVATATLAIFPPFAVHGLWQAPIPTAAALAAYEGALAAWGRAYLGPLDPRVAELAERVTDAADDTALILFAAWRARPRPPEPAVRAAHALMLLRELRGGLHFAALRASGIDVPVAVLGDPRGGPERLLRTGWRPEDVETLQARAADVEDLAGRWLQASAATDAAFDACLAVLSDAERAELAAGITRAEELSRASAPAHQR